MHIRAALPADLQAVALLAGELVRQHHSYDPQRFLLVPKVEEGYVRFFGQELDNPDAVILVAEREKVIHGYAYGRIEPRDWNALREACGMFHDIYVAPAARRAGVAKMLVEAMVAELSRKGAPRVVLTTAVQNASAQALFGSLGFRVTMLEMTRETT